MPRSATACIKLAYRVPLPCLSNSYTSFSGSSSACLNPSSLCHEARFLIRSYPITKRRRDSTGSVFRLDFRSIPGIPRLRRTNVKWFVRCGDTPPAQFIRCRRALSESERELKPPAPTYVSSVRCNSQDAPFQVGSSNRDG